MKKVIFTLGLVLFSIVLFGQSISFEESKNAENLFKYYRQATREAFNSAISNKKVNINCVDTVEIYIDHNLVLNKVSYLLKSTRLNNDFVLKSDDLDEYFYVSPTYNFSLMEIFNTPYNQGVMAHKTEEIINYSDGYKFKFKYVVFYN